MSSQVLRLNRIETADNIPNLVWHLKDLWLYISTQNLRFVICVMVFLTLNGPNTCMKKIGQPKRHIYMQITKFCDCSYVYFKLHFSRFLNFLTNSAKSLKQVTTTQFKMDWFIGLIEDWWRMVITIKETKKEKLVQWYVQLYWKNRYLEFLTPKWPQMTPAWPSINHVYRKCAFVLCGMIFLISGPNMKTIGLAEQQIYTGIVIACRNR